MKRSTRRLLLGGTPPVNTAPPSGGAVPENITLTWNGDTLDLTPDFALDSLEFAVNDVVEERRSPSDPTVTTYTSAQATIIAVDPGTGAITLDSTFDFSGDWTPGTWYAQVWLKRGADYIGKSNIETLTLTSVAPVLSLPTDAATGMTTASGSVSTTQYDGTLYAVVTTSATSPSAAQIKLGQNHLGAAAAAAKSQAVSGSGVQTISGGFTGLSASTTYYIHYMHENRWSQQSNVSSADGFTTYSATPVLSSPVDSAGGDTTGIGSVSTTIPDGTLYFVVTTSVTSPSAAQVKAGQNHTGAAAVDSGSQAVTATGVQSITGGFTGLTPVTAYYAHYMHESAGAIQSSVSTADGFTTDSTYAPAVYVDHNAQNAATAKTTTHSINFGSFSSTKTAVITVNYFATHSGAFTNSLTVNGASANPVVSHYNGAWGKTAMFAIDVTGGGTKSIVFTSSINLYNVDVAVVLLTGMNSTAVGTDKEGAVTGTVVKTLFNGSSGNGSGVQDLPSGGAMVLAAANQYNVSLTFGGGVTQDQDLFIGASGTVRSAVAHHSGSDVNPTITVGASTAYVAVGAMWGP